MGVQADGYGESNGIPQTQRWVQFAFNYLADQGLTERKGRGLWTITQKGVDVLKTHATLVDAPTQETPMQEQQVTPDAPVSLALSIAVTAGLVPDYHPDPYIRALATDLKLTPCFGSYSSQAPTCGRCPAMRLCVNATAATFSNLVATLAAEDAAAAAQAAERARIEELKSRTPKPTQSFPPLDVLTFPTGAADSPAPPVAPAFNSATLDLKTERMIKAAAAVNCPRCLGDIPEGTQSVWVRGNGGKSKGSGIFHVQCFEALRKEAGIKP
jgi:hypothetical protein